MVEERNWKIRILGMNNRDRWSRQVHLNVTERMTGAAPTHPLVVRGLPAWLFESCEFSNTASERLEHRLHQEIRHYDGNRFILIATKHL